MHLLGFFFFFFCRIPFGSRKLTPNLFLKKTKYPCFTNNLLLAL